MTDYNTPAQYDPHNVYAIRNPEKVAAMGHYIWYTLLDPWNRGFYATAFPKLFNSQEKAEQFCQENSISNFEIVKGYLDESQGFLPDEF